MPWNSQHSYTFNTESTNKVVNNKEFTQFLEKYPWSGLDIQELKDLRNKAIKIGPQAIILLIQFLIDNVSQEKFDSLNIHTIYSYLISWVFAQESIEQEHKDMIVFLANPKTKNCLNIRDIPEQHVSLIDRCFAKNLPDLAAFFIKKFHNSIPTNKALEFLYEAFKHTIEIWNNFDDIAYIFLKNKKIILDDITKILKTNTLFQFLLKRDCYKTILYCSEDPQYDPNLYWQGKDLTLIELAAQLGNEEIVKLLIEKGAIINPKKNFLGYSDRPRPLQLATQHKHKNIVQLLLEKGAAEIDAKDEKGYSAIDYALAANDTGLLEILEYKRTAAITFTGIDLDFKLKNCLKSKNKKGISYIITHSIPGEILLYNENKKFLIHYFAEYGDIDNLKLICNIYNQFKNNKDGNSFNSMQEYNLYHSSNLSKYLDERYDLLDINTTALIIATCYKHENIVDFLLQNGVDPNITDNDERTALHYAAQYDLQTIGAKLLEKNANLNVKDDKGNTALHDAVSAKNKGFVRLLLDKNANVNLKNTQGHKPLDLAENNSVIKSIIETKPIEKSSNILAQTGSKGIYEGSKTGTNGKNKIDTEANKKTVKIVETEMAEGYRTSLL